MPHGIDHEALVQRVAERRGGMRRTFDRFDPARTAHVIVDMQNGFLEEGAPVEVPEARTIVDNINRISRAIREAGDLETRLVPYLDRPIPALSPVEHAVLLLAAYELLHRIETPYCVVINEAVELAKAYGGTDGHKYVNGVLDKLAGELRAIEVQAAGRAPGRH